MAQFSYKAKQGPQKIVEGNIEAESIDGAVMRIIEMGYTPIDVKHLKKGSGKEKLKIKKSFQNLLLDFSKRIPRRDIVIFTRQLADLIDAGVPILRTLKIVEKQTKHVHLKKIVNDLQHFVQDGGTVSDGLAQYPAVFPNLYINIIRSGEVGGKLNLVLNRLVDLMEREQETHGQVVSSLLYPAFIVVVGIIVIFILMSWVIPQITLLFEDMSENLPLPTIILIKVSNFFAGYWWVILLIVGSAVVYIQRMGSTESGELFLDRLKLKIPLFGEFIKDVEIGRFARTLGTLLDNGVVIITALESVKLVVENAVLRQEIENITHEVVNGASLTIALQSSPLFPETAINMITIGEETGQIHDGLYKLATFYERQTQRVVKGIVSLLGPSLILVIGIMVGSIVVAILMPILKMNTIIG